jgi:hypothetical protein
MSSLSDNAPLRTRLSSCMWPPTPSRRPRCTQSVRMYVPASQETQNTARLRFSSNSNSLDSWIVRIRSCRFTAEMSGGRWKRAPVRVSRARGRAVGLESAECKRNTQTYSLPEEHRLVIFWLLMHMSQPTCALLRLDESCRAINANDKAPGNLGIKSTAMTRLLDSQYSSEPGDNLMRGRV